MKRLLLFIVLTAWMAASVQAETRAPAVAGFPDGAVLSGPAGDYSSPAVFDLDGNAGNGLEIVQTTGDGRVFAVSNSGSVLWNSSIPSANCVGAVGNRIHSSPAVGKLDGKNASVVVGFGAGPLSCDSYGCGPGEGRR